MTLEHMDTSQILLLRVGMDSGFGGLGPLFPDGTFEYVPIPDAPSRVSVRSLFFRDILARSGGSVARFVPAKHKEDPAHYDPEFETFTYGDPTKNKRRQLLRLGRGDMLVFYAGLRPPEAPRGSKLYIIGYLDYPPSSRDHKPVSLATAWIPTPLGQRRFLGVTRATRIS